MGKGGRCVRLTTLPPSCAVVMKSGNLNFLEPSGPLQACKGTALPLPFTVQPDRPQMTIWRMRVAWWIPKATNTQSEYVTLIAFPHQQWLQEGASMLRYAYIACLVPTHCKRSPPIGMRSVL